MKRERISESSVQNAAPANRGTTANPLVWAIVVSHNGARWIRDCLASLLSSSYEPLRLLVIDNASRDGTDEIVRSEFPSVELVRFRTNVGYGAACNKGIEAAYEAGAAHVVLLNQDILVTRSWLEPLVSVAEAIPSLGILSPLQMEYDSGQVDQYVERIIASMWVDNPDISAEWADNVVTVRNVIGAAMLLPRRTVERVGGFDPIYFMYGEETDLCERALFHGLYPAMVRNSIVRHYSRLGAKELHGRVRRCYVRNQYICFLKNPHFTFARNLYSYLRGGFSRISSRLCSEASKAELSGTSRPRIAAEIVGAQARIALALHRLWRTHCEERRGSYHLDLRPSVRVPRAAPRPVVNSRSSSRETPDRLRVLIGVPHNPFTSLGGAEMHVNNIATQLRREGHAVRVVCVDREHVFSSGGGHRTEEVDGILVDTIQLPDESRNTRLGWTYSCRFVERKMREIANDFEPDVFHLISGYLLTASAATAMYSIGVPVVLSLVDYWFFCPRLHRVCSVDSLCEQADYGADCARCLSEERRRFRLPAWYAPWMTRSLRAIGHRTPVVRNRFERHAQVCLARHQFLNSALQQAHAIVSPSRHVLRLAAEEGVPESKLHYIPHGITAGFSNVHLDKRDDERLRLGCFGTITHLKGVHIAVEAARRFSSDSGVELAIYGGTNDSPSYVRRLQRSAAACPWIRFVGTVPHEELPRVISELDAVVVPTLCIETFSFIVHEAFAAGTPVIVSRTPYTEQAVQDGVNGLVFRRNDAKDLYEKISELRGNPALLAALRNGAPSVRTIEEEMQQVLAVYRSASASRSANELNSASPILNKPAVRLA